MMKKFLSLAAIAMVGAIFSCQSEDEAVSTKEVNADVLAKISAMGFSTDNVQVVDGAYLVEGDILLHNHDLNGGSGSQTVRAAEAEQYRTFNLVTGAPRVITVSSGAVNAAVSSAIDAAIARYNAENLTISFQRVTSGGQIHIVYAGGNFIASAGFPSGGNPYNEIKFNKRYETYSAGFLTTVIAHEMGHCIGFRHTDYMNRAYSCGSGGNEGQVTTGVGAVHIPNTPTVADPGSWMLACLSATTNRPFNNNDKTALSYLY